MSFEVNYEEDLVPRIRDLIDGYSKNSILKEYLQNADDAGSTELVVTFDKRIHTSLNGTIFEVAKEKSLLLYNNASFKDKDFEAIFKLSAQGKKEDANATGRFGQGFSSSFSISDHPSFVASGKIYWFDVLRNAVSKGKDKSIQGWSVEKDAKEIAPWLKTFNIDNSQSGTTFRLPLRNDKTANQSDISHEVFKYEDFLNWCVEWKGNTSGLLFLRHIQKLVLQEINEDNEKIIHVEISTKNSKEIHEYNNKIQNEFSTSLLAICNIWKNSEKILPLFTYKHHFLIKYFDRDKNTYHDFEESWAVVNGLFRGEEDTLIDQAIKVLNISPNPRKVLPWAGVAISLDEQGNVKKNNASSYHTFLPLPIKSKHPVHIHGWFDLNPKRTEITYDGSGDDKDILIEWNRLLFKEGVGIAWAHLIDFIKKSCDSRSYYSLWPKNHDDEFDQYLLDGFYKEITKLECFFIKYKEETRWNKPTDDIYFFQSKENNKKLFDAFKENFQMISPEPRKRIVDSLRKVGVELQEITPIFIREYLDTASDELAFPLAMETIPITMLSKKEWLLLILVFCAEADDDKNYSYLDGLPLELTIENKINIIDKNKLLDRNPNLFIFDNDSSLFIDAEIIEIVKDAELLPSSWLEPDLNNYLTVLQEHIGNYDRTNKKWLESLVSMISNASESEVCDAVNELYRLEVVYQHDGEFTQLKDCIDSPVLITAEQRQNINFIEQTDINLVHLGYIDTYEPLLKLRKHKLIKELNSSSLIRHLVRLPEDKYEFFKNKNTREYLIDLIAQDNTWMEELNEQELGWFNDMPFIATESGNIYAKSDGKKLYISAVFKPPKHILNLKGEYEIIHISGFYQYALYEKMGFDVQNPINYLNQIIIPFLLGDNSADDVRNILEWLATNWEELTKDLDEDGKLKLIATFSNSKIVLNTNSELGIASKYYLPSFFYMLPLSLQDKSFLPIVFEDKVTQDNWEDLLSKMGASAKIIPEHIVFTVKSITRDEHYGLAVDLLNYISNHFECFNEMKLCNKNIFECLSLLAWIPVENPGNNFLSPEHEYKKLCKPSELILKNDHSIAGGSHYCLSNKVKLGKKDKDGEFTERDVAEKLGILVKLPNDSVFNSFCRLSSIGADQVPENKILDYAKQFYKFLGRSNISESDIPDDIKEKSVFVKGHWIASSRVFQTSIGLTEVFSWDEIISSDGKESNLAQGLVKLGVLDKPDNDYLINYINELPKNQKLDKKQLEDAKVILKQFQNNLEELLDVDDIPLLSRADQLIANDEIYIRDLAAYINSERRNDQLEFCQGQFEKLAEHCGVISLVENIKPELDLENSKKSEGANNVLNDYIRLESFKVAILRLIYHEGKISDEDLNHESINAVLPSKVLSMDTLVVRYFIDDVWIYDDLNTPAYQDIENSTLYLLNQDDDEDMCESIANFICVESRLKNSESITILNRILRNQYNTNEEIQNLLDKKNIKSLPEKFEKDEVGLLYVNDKEIEEYSDESGVIVNDYINEVQGSSPVSFSETEDDTQIDFETKNEHQSLACSEKEIPPPITPKISNSTNNENESSSLPEGYSFQSNVNKVDRKGNGGGSTKPSISDKNNFGPSESKIVSPNDRKPVYVGKEREDGSDNQQEKIEYATEIGNRGENFVIENAVKYLLCESNLFDRAQTNNKGFDVSEVDSNGEIVRYIEIKTLTGDWGEGGVGLTAAQLKFAQDNENWWLFVVENINTNNTTVHTFKNPVHQANRFMFDHSWIQLAETTKNPQLLVPKLGDKHMILEGTYEIVNLETKGKLYKVRLKEVQTGEQLIKNFDPKWVKC